MIFTKDQKKDVKPSTSKGQLNKGQYPFMGESEDSDAAADNLGQPQASTSSYYDKRRRSSPQHSGGQKKYDMPPKVQVPPTPVVLDKFGSFRLATADRTSPKAPMQFQRRSRSRSSSSRQSSRTPPRRRSRSSSYPKRRHSRSMSYRSRSSYSRSRSRSVDRHRFDKRRTNYRGTGFYKTRFNPRGGYRGRGGGRGRDRPFRARGGRYINRGRDDHRRYDRDRNFDYDDRRDRFRSSPKDRRRSNTPQNSLGNKGKGENDNVSTSAAGADN